VRLLPHQVAQALGITGAVFTVARADGAAAAGRVHVSFDYAGFKYAYGGDYAARLRLVELPSCALTTPRVSTCREQTPVVSGDDVATARAGADVIVPGNASPRAGGALVLALTASAQGSAGDFAAEPVSETDQWISGGSSGTYEYTDSIQVPPVPGGLEPDASLKYDSQLADGVTAAANPEASEVGDGWKSAVPGYIETNYQTCAANWSEPDILDLCDQVQSESLAMNGAVGPIVLPSSGADKKEADDTSDVQPLSGGGWEIIDPDGAQYYYGVNKLPGWTTGDPQTNSIWTVPLWSGGSELTPDAAWRYMLDYEVDPEGDAIAYFYNTQNNYYATDGGSTANGAYTAGGVLAKAEYGLRNNGNIYTQTPAAEINYSYSTTRQDAPTDLTCASGAACSVNAPTFWTSDALTGITTESLNGSSLKPVDSYQLTDSFPATGDPTSSPNLWLSSIQQTGEDGSTPVTLPPADFAGTPMPNLDQTSADKSHGYSLITRDRLTAITNDSGGVTGVAYTGEQSACSSASFPSLWANSDRCYPNYWYTNPLADTEQLDWYNLYATASVTQTDTTGGGKPVVTAYTYGTPGWHYDNDDGSTSAYPTWDEWRGFQTVTTETGTSPDPVTETVDTYYQGLSDDEGAYTVTGGEEGNGTINITTSRGIVVQDQDQDAGMLLEERVFDGAGGSEVTDTEYDVPWSEETATQSVNSSLYLYRDAYLTDATQTIEYTDLASGGSDESTTTDSLDSKEDVLSEDAKPWGAAETCTTTSYVTNTASNLTEPETVKVNAGSCASPGALVSETQYGYDGGSIGAAPTKGLVTEVQKTITTSGATATYLASYDEYGRIISTTDPDGRVTSTAYTPATGAEPTEVAVTDPMGLTTTTTYDPARELPLTVTTPAGYATTISYDALGRATAKWTPGNPTSGNPQFKYSYIVSQTAPAATIAQTQQPGGGYLASASLLDALGRPIETQTGTASGGSDITQDSYNSDGENSFAEGPYYTSAPPSGTLVTAADTSVTDETGYGYDGDGRMTTQTALLTKDPDLRDLGSDEPAGGAHPYIDRDDVHEIYRSWRALTESYGDRVLIGEIWLPDATRFARYLSPGELHTVFNFPYLCCPWNAAELRKVIDSTLELHAPAGAPATWVLSSHDVDRQVSRYGRPDTSFSMWARDHTQPVDIALGTRRASAAVLVTMALPGSVYVCQGEELGLWEVEDIPGDQRQDPIWHRTGGADPGRDGSRVPLPWSGTAPPFGFSPPGSPARPWLPQPAGWRDLTVQSESDGAGSMLSLYRTVLAIRHREPALGDGQLTWLPAPDGVLAFDRGGVACIANISAAPVDLPPHSEILLASAPLTDARLPVDTAVWLRLPSAWE
jgi:YD repeat-containing protein